MPGVRELRIGETAIKLGVSERTLRDWGDAYGFPTVKRTPGGHRRYREREVLALRDALKVTTSVASAMQLAQRVGDYDEIQLATAFRNADFDRAARILDRGARMRTMEEAIEEILLPAVDVVTTSTARTSVAWARVAQWVNDWLVLADHTNPPAGARDGILIGDATGGRFDPQLLAVRSLAVFCRRANLRVLTLPVEATAGLNTAVTAFAPTMAVYAGKHVADDLVARWAVAVHAICGDELRTGLYQREPLVGRSRVVPLSPSPSSAVSLIRALLDAPPARPADDALPDTETAAAEARR